MADLTKIETFRIREGMRFSSPVFFEDGKNMFLAEKKPVKRYHLDSLKRWHVPFLLTYGHEINETDFDSMEDVDDSVEELGGLEEL